MNELWHYGVDHVDSKVGPGSGRYHYGSGDNPFQHPETIKSRIAKLQGEINPDTGQVYTDQEIAYALGYRTYKGGKEVGSISELNKAKSAESYNEKIQRYNDIINYIDKCQKGPSGDYSDGYMPSKNEIAKALGLANESTVRSALSDEALANLQERTDALNYIMDVVDSGKYLDISKGSELGINGGITDSMLDNCVWQLANEQGYAIHNVGINQVGTGKTTTCTVICPPGTEWKEAMNNQTNIVLPEGSYADPNSKEVWKMQYPQAIDLDRVYIDYPKGDVGQQQDGLIEIRPGVQDLYLGDNINYAQVRIGVNDSSDDANYYLKGMAVYNDNIPEGYDIIFHTSKSPDKELKDVLKPYKFNEADPNNPFGASIMVNGQSNYIGNDGQEHLSAINKVNEAGSWNEWRKVLASQFWSKQTPELAQQQLDLNYMKAVSELETIQSVPQANVRKYLLDNFASSCDTNANELTAAALPGQKPKVILPVPSLGDNEIYDPDLPDGTVVCLVRFPHAGRFEIPTLTVNNQNAEARKMIGANAPDAVCINSKAAEYLSGADFDGDTALVIPNNNGMVKTSARLEGLIGFNQNQPKELGGYEYSKEELKNGAHVMTGQETQMQMGIITNLITDMSFQNPTDDELARAVRHSMVIIDAKKHKLDYEKSYVDNDIESLKQKYQRTYDEDGNVIKTGGSSTIISRATSTVQDLPLRTEYPTINKETGELEWKLETRESKLYYTKPEPVRAKAADGKHYIYEKNEDGTYKLDDKGKKIPVYEKNEDGTTKVEWVKTERHSTSTKMAEANTDEKVDALVGMGATMEYLAADYAKKMKHLANDARKEMVNTPTTRQSKAAAEEYADEVASLTAKLNEALKNSPRERQAQIIANSQLKQAKQNDPTVFEDKEKARKLKSRCLDAARAETGASKSRISSFTDREWEAILAGAFTSSDLDKILDQCKKEAIVKRATPNTYTALTSAQVSTIKYMLNAGYTQADIASEFGISTSTIARINTGKYEVEQ